MRGVVIMTRIEIISLAFALAFATAVCICGGIINHKAQDDTAYMRASTEITAFSN